MDALAAATSHRCRRQHGRQPLHARRQDLRSGAPSSASRASTSTSPAAAACWATSTPTSVSAAFTFFEPGAVRTLWEQGRAVMPAERGRHGVRRVLRRRWAEAHVPDDLDAARLAELAGQVVAAARPACAAVFAGWRALPVPASPKAAAVHQMNALRELRLGLHGAAVDHRRPHAARRPCRCKSPHMVPLFGWPEPADVDGVQARWDDAEDAHRPGHRPRLRGARRRRAGRAGRAGRRPPRGDVGMTGSYSGGADAVDRRRAGPARRRARPHPRRLPAPPRRAAAVERPGRAPRRPHLRRRRAHDPLLPGGARLPAHDDVREPRPRRARPTSSSTSAPATRSPSSTCPGVDPGPYAEVLGGLHHLAISIEVEHWQPGQGAPRRRPASPTTTSTRPASTSAAPTASASSSSPTPSAGCTASGWTDHSRSTRHRSATAACPAEEDLLGDGGDVDAVGAQDVADAEAAAGQVGVAGEVVDVPLVGPDGRWNQMAWSRLADIQPCSKASPSPGPGRSGWSGDHRVGRAGRRRGRRGRRPGARGSSPMVVRAACSHADPAALAPRCAAAAKRRSNIGLHE